jgi:hypothetical protein
MPYRMLFVLIRLAGVQLYYEEFTVNGGPEKIGPRAAGWTTVIYSTNIRYHFPSRIVRSLLYSVPYISLKCALTLKSMLFIS